MHYETRIAAGFALTKMTGLTGEPPRLLITVQAAALDVDANVVVTKELAITFDLPARKFSVVNCALIKGKRQIDNVD